MFNLEGRGRDFGVAEEIHQELAVEIADADGLGHALAHQFLHSRPGLLYCSIAGDDVLAIVGEAGWVALSGVHIFEGNGKVDDVKLDDFGVSMSFLG